MKFSKGKITLPGNKQVFRQRDDKGCYSKDVIGLGDEEVEGEPLLVKVIEKGEIIYDLPKLEEIRENTLKSLSQLPDKYKQLTDAPRYPVILSPQLKTVQEQTYPSPS
jgi:nicotinate phosphoribosyltransferase